MSTNRIRVRARLHEPEGPAPVEEALRRCRCGQRLSLDLDLAIEIADGHWFEITSEETSFFIDVSLPAARFALGGRAPFPQESLTEVVERLIRDEVAGRGVARLQQTADRAGFAEVADALPRSPAPAIALDLDSNVIEILEAQE